MSNSMVKSSNDSDEQLLEKVILQNDLAGLSSIEKVQHVKNVCVSLGLNPLTKPIQLHKFQGKEVMYMSKEGAEQIRKLNNASIIKMDTEILRNDIYVVKAYAQLPNGRQDCSTAALSIAGLKGDAIANAMMKCECVPTDYQILTKNGFKNYLDLEIGELVSSYNLESDELEWVPLLDISVFNNKLVKNYSSSVTSFDFTNGHKWVFLNSNKNNPNLIEYEDAKENERILLSAKNNSIENNLNVTKYESAILGWIITDGTIKKYKGKYYRASICQSKIKNIEIIDELLKNIGKVTKGTTYNRKNNWMNQVWWYLSVKQTKELFDKFDFKSLDDLPRIAANLNFECRKSMIESMLLADGDKRNHFGKSKLQVIECFQILCTLNGIALTKTKTRIFGNSTKNFYEVGMLTYTSIVKKNLKEKYEYISDVWCPTTKYGNWIMRSPEGQISITGNTKAKRRVTLSICGLGMLSEEELDTLPKDNIHVKKIENKPIKEINFDLDEALLNISQCTSVDELKKLVSSYSSLKSSLDKESIDKIIDAKNKKQESFKLKDLEKDIDDFIKEFDSVDMETGEIKDSQ